MAAPKKEKVIIRSYDRENDEFEAFVGVNGKSYQIKLGEEVEIDETVRTVLKSAMMVKHEPLRDAKGELTGKMKEVSVPRYIIEKV